MIKKYSPVMSFYYSTSDLKEYTLWKCAKMGLKAKKNKQISFPQHMNEMRVGGKIAHWCLSPYRQTSYILLSLHLPHGLEVGVEEILHSALNNLIWALDSSPSERQAPTTTAPAPIRTCNYSHRAKEHNCFDNKDVIVKESYLASNYNANIIIKRLIQRIFWILQT